MKIVLTYASAVTAAVAIALGGNLTFISLVLALLLFLFSFSMLSEALSQAREEQQQIDNGERQ